MGREKGSRTGRCQGCNHLEHARIERLLAAGASSKETARKFAINYHALRRHWINHVSADARAAYIAGSGVTKDQLQAIVADESLALIDHYRIVRGKIPRAWADGFARLHPDRPPGDVPAKRWLQFVDEVGRILDSPFCAVAVTLGWEAYDLFGADRDRPYARIDRVGLLWL